MSIFKKILTLSIILIVVFSFSLLVFAQDVKPLSPQEVERIIKESGSKHTLEDYSLSSETVKWLSPQEIKDILNSMTPEEAKTAGKDPSQSSNVNNPQPQTNNPTSGTVNCFDYYHFGSIQTNIIAQGFVFNSGEVINFSGTIENQNAYPIVSGTLYIKIFRQTNATKNSNGPDVVDQFIVKEDLVIPAKGEIPVSFSWKVPKYLTTGNYTLATFFEVDKKFNLLGLSFTDDVIGNSFNFQVIGPKDNVQFDKSGVTINNKPYFFAVFLPQIPSKDPAIIKAKIDNTTNQDQSIDISWKLYRWDAINPENLIRTEKDTIIIKARSSENIQITIPEALEPVYYLVGELKYQDSKSIINVRFIRPEVNRIRINFPSVTSFPIKTNEPSTIFSCLHNSGTAQLVPDGKLTLVLTDQKGKVIEEYTYQGVVTGEMMAVKKDFISQDTFDHFFLTAQLWQQGKLVDQSTLEYNCKNINPELCKQKIDYFFGYPIAVLPIVITIIIIIILSAYILIRPIFKKKK